eukprot:EG_transcript_9654
MQNKRKISAPHTPPLAVTTPKPNIWIIFNIPLIPLGQQAGLGSFKALELRIQAKISALAEEAQAASGSCGVSWNKDRASCDDVPDLLKSSVDIQTWTVQHADVGEHHEHVSLASK